MSDTERDLFLEANHQHLMHAVKEVRALLSKVLPSARGPAEAPAPWPDELPPPALEELSDLLSLSPFERSLLVFSAGVELDGSLSELCGPGRCLTVGLALATFPDAHWSAFLPDGPLRYWRLLEVQEGPYLNNCSLSIDERVLHFLCGFKSLDPALLHLLSPGPGREELVDSHRKVALSMAAAWSHSHEGTLPVLQLCGSEAADKGAVAGVVAALLRHELWRLNVAGLPYPGPELEGLLLHLRREFLLRPGIVLFDCDTLEADHRTLLAAERLVAVLHAPLLISIGERRPWPRRAVLSFDVDKPTPREQLGLWRDALGEHGALLEPTLGRLVEQFHLGALKIHAACAQGVGQLAMDEVEVSPETLAPLLWRTCRVQARPRLESRAQRIEPAASWEDLVLPEGPSHLLREIVHQVRWRGRVYEDWGFARRHRRGLGIAVLLAGTSGTGKTLAAEVVAGELELDLYRIDLSTVVSKYIGETEKNLERIFTAAEEGGAVLLFDEADALFGKRSEVKDSHDRHANVEVSYLLQRMESFRGLALLTSNLRESIDTAFLRRFRFVVDFPFPDVDQRQAIWRLMLPPQTPTEGFDPERLAELPLTGGSIRNVALNAAFFAAAADRPLTMDDLARAAESELNKLGRIHSVLGLAPPSGDSP